MIMKDISAEQKAEQENLIALGELAAAGSTEIYGRYQFRNGKGAKPQVPGSLPSMCVSTRKNVRSESQPPKKRPRKT